MDTNTNPNDGDTLTLEERSIAFALGEIAFVLLPLLVIFGVQLYMGKLHHFLCEPEWSILSCVMFGQSIVKVSHAIAEADKVEKFGVGLWFALLILAVVVSVGVLIYILATKEEDRSTYVGIFQFIVFWVSLLVFYNLSRLQVEVGGE
jgi:hypothetical protein